MANLSMHIEAYRQQTEEEYRTSWEQTRALAFNIAQYAGRVMKNPAITLNSFWSFPWDEQSSAAVDLIAAAKAFKQQNKFKDFNGRNN